MTGHQVEEKEGTTKEKRGKAKELVKAGKAIGNWRGLDGGACEGREGDENQGEATKASGEFQGVGDEAPDEFQGEGAEASSRS